MHEDVEFQYCPVCGGTLRSKTLKPEEPERLVCSKCDFVFYLDPKVVACSIVEMDGRVVLLKRAIDPQNGKWVLPGGYVDRGEEAPCLYSFLRFKAPPGAEKKGETHAFLGFY